MRGPTRGVSRDKLRLQVAIPSGPSHRPASTMLPGARIERHCRPAASWHPAGPGVRMDIRVESNV
jgi:hypothetical protein